eukprot:CAMPEP_0113624308 /NCGR_PEP_ID=MMETSP0017_2-20120614/12527_1 /TAXON_ID=2856 /ORGANISM="Cylindrotheca closterium" /LENGTH=166 /DNA_ID=CAMNT_0000534327 /DNA_START=91 /DNA_END=591 /DNA_ORIENTATION=- /assembly_acc=CAM_ASM_000147
MNKISQPVLRTTRRGSYKQLKKAVAFDQAVLVFEDDSFSEEERKDMFYTNEDMRSFKTEIWRFQELSQDAFSQQISSPPSAPDADTCPASYTGMEGFLHPERKMKHRLQGVLSVLMEQERQYKEQGLWTPVDFDSMSHSYHMASQESQEEAHQRALIQRKVVSEAA